MRFLSRCLPATALVLLGAFVTPGQEVPRAAGFEHVRKLVQDHVDRLEIAGAVEVIETLTCQMRRTVKPPSLSVHRVAGPSARRWLC